jgi:hypothetical protein
MSEQLEVSRVLLVTKRALIQRINRKLRDRGQVVKAARARAWRFVGSYYAVDVKQNQIVGRRIDLEKFGRELGALAEWEEMEKPDLSEVRKEPVDLSQYKKSW